MIASLVRSMHRDADDPRPETALDQVPVCLVARCAHADFELPIRSKETFRLSDALQKVYVILLTYVFDFSPG